MYSSFLCFQGPPGFKGSEGYLGEEGIAVSQGFFNCLFQRTYLQYELICVNLEEGNKNQIPRTHE